MCLRCTQPWCEMHEYVYELLYYSLLYYYQEFWFSLWVIDLKRLSFHVLHLVVINSTGLLHVAEHIVKCTKWFENLSRSDALCSGVFCCYVFCFLFSHFTHYSVMYYHPGVIQSRIGSGLWYDCVSCSMSSLHKSFTTWIQHHRICSKLNSIHSSVGLSTVTYCDYRTLVQYSCMYQVILHFMKKRMLSSRWNSENCNSEFKYSTVYEYFPPTKAASIV